MSHVGDSWFEIKQLLQSRSKEFVVNSSFPKVFWHLQLRLINCPNVILQGFSLTKAQN